MSNWKPPPSHLQPDTGLHERSPTTSAIGSSSSSPLSPCNTIQDQTNQHIRPHCSVHTGHVLRMACLVSISYVIGLGTKTLKIILTCTRFNSCTKTYGPKKVSLAGQTPATFYAIASAAHATEILACACMW